jgi:hypothetical protein
MTARPPLREEFNGSGMGRCYRKEARWQAGRHSESRRAVTNLRMTAADVAEAVKAVKRELEQ